MRRIDWNSQHDSICEILKYIDKLPELFKSLSLPLLQDIEIEFLKEFQSCVHPFAICLDRLQGDKCVHCT